MAQTYHQLYNSDNRIAGKQPAVIHKMVVSNTFSWYVAKNKAFDSLRTNCVLKIRPTTRYSQQSLEEDLFQFLSLNSGAIVFSVDYITSLHELTSIVTSFTQCDLGLLLKSIMKRIKDNIFKKRFTDFSFSINIVFVFSVRNKSISATNSSNSNTTENFTSERKYYLSHQYWLKYV